jgi:nucleotide-binding universal stress UspA family protein
MIALKNVLVATDFSEPSRTALEYGRAFARTFGATLHVVHVVENGFTQ